MSTALPEVGMTAKAKPRSWKWVYFFFFPFPLPLSFFLPLVAYPASREKHCDTNPCFSLSEDAAGTWQESSPVRNRQGGEDTPGPSFGYRSPPCSKVLLLAPAREQGGPGLQREVVSNTCVTPCLSQAYTTLVGCGSSTQTPSGPR